MAESPRSRADQPRADVRRNRDRMLDAAAVVLARDADASLAAIADEAGLSRATAYRHFPDVDAVRAALLEEAQQVGKDLLSDHLQEMFGAGGQEPPLIEMVEATLRIALPMRHRWTIAIASEPVPDSGFTTTFSPIAQAFLRRAQTRGEVREDLDLVLMADGLVATALHAVRRLHSDGLTIEQTLQLVTPYLDGLRKAAERRVLDTDD